MLKSVLVLVDHDIFLHFIVSHHVFDEFFVFLVLLFFSLFLWFFLDWFSLLLHDAFILEILKFNQLCKFFVLDFSNQNDFLETFEFFELLGVRQESKIESFNNGATLEISQGCSYFNVFPFVLSGDVVEVQLWNDLVWNGFQSVMLLLFIRIAIKDLELSSVSA